MEFTNYSSPGYLSTVASNTADGLYALITDHALPDDQAGLELSDAVHLKRSVHPKLTQLESELNSAQLGASAIPILFLHQYHGTALLVGPLEDLTQDKLMAIYAASGKAGMSGKHFRLAGWNFEVPPGTIDFFLGREFYRSEFYRSNGEKHATKK